MKKEVKKSLLNSMFSSRKATFVSLTVFLSVLLIVGVLLFFFWDRQKEPVDGIYYYPADYSADIFQNVAYTTFTRDLLYGAGGVEQLFNYEMDLESSSAECKFFLRYFHSVIYGEYEKIGESTLTASLKKSRNSPCKWYMIPMFYIILPSRKPLTEKKKPFITSMFDTEFSRITVRFERE